MPPFFPRHTVEWRIEEPTALRRLTLSLWAVAAVAGVLVRLVRWGGLSLAGAEDWWMIIGSLALGGVVLAGLATVHLGNFPVGQWMWRAPLFGLVAGVAEAGVSAVLLAAGLERIGSSAATWSDWPSMVATAVLWDIVTVSLFAAVLAITVQMVRTLLLPTDRGL